jgi:hypothetical protein
LVNTNTDFGITLLSLSPDLSSLSVPHFPHLEKEDNSSYFRGLLRIN